MRGLTSVVRHTINDSVDYEMRKDEISRCQFFLGSFLDVLDSVYVACGIEKIPIFNPENPIKIIFNCVIVVYNCFYLYLRTL